MMEEKCPMCGGSGKAKYYDFVKREHGIGDCPDCEDNSVKNTQLRKKYLTYMTLISIF